ncbi:glycosyltransferase [Chloroflexota bacterium]
MLYHQPLVSVCLPTYNVEKTVENTLRSILAQTYKNMEIIVVDNVSTDNTLNIIRELKDSRIKTFSNEENLGGEGNWSRCIELANGDYIAIFHADDLYMPNIVEKQVRAFQDNPNIGAVFTLANLINEKDEVFAETSLPVGLSGKRIYYFVDIFVSILENSNFLMCPSCIVRGKLYKELAPFDEKRFRTSADLDMWLRILDMQPITIINEKLMSYRIIKAPRYNYLRTESHDFFTVMDNHLGDKSSVLDIPQRSLYKYEFLRSLDKLTRAENHLIKGNLQDAKELVKEAYSKTVFLGALSNIRQPERFPDWIIGAILLVLVNLGLGRYLGRFLHWFLYTFKRRAF